MACLVLLVLQGCAPRSERTVLSEYLPERVKSGQAPRSRNSHNLSIYFVRSGASGAEMVTAKRSFSGKDELAEALQLLLNGPTANEAVAGFGSEIPAGTVLIGVNREKDKVTIDLSRRFAMGGGIESFETRMEQLKRTVKSCGEPLPVFLTVEGKLLTITEGEGIEVKQPINR